MKPIHNFSPWRSCFQTCRSVLLRILLLLFVLNASVHADILPNDVIIGGNTIGEWTAICWKWIYSIPTNQNPQLDCDGEFANNRQPDKRVFLIAPLNGNQQPCVRTFTVPEDTFVLLPVLCVTIDNIATVPPYTLEQMHDALNSVLNIPEELHASVDGIAVTNLLDHRATTPPIGVNFPSADNSLAFFYQQPIVGLVEPTIADGYWLMLEPLSLGQHVLRAGGKIPVAYLVPEDITCNITVIAIPLPDRVQQLILSVASSGLGQSRKQPLLASLREAKLSFERKRPRLGISFLMRFQQKVHRELARNPALAHQFIESAQKIINKAR
jgi:hypothetical protein